MPHIMVPSIKSFRGVNRKLTLWVPFMERFIKSSHGANYKLLRCAQVRPDVKSFRDVN